MRGSATICSRVKKQVALPRYHLLVLLHQHGHRTYSSAAAVSVQQNQTNDLNSHMQSGVTYFKYFQWDRAMQNFSHVIDETSKQQRHERCDTDEHGAVGGGSGARREVLDGMREKLILAYRYRGKLHHMKQEYKKAVEDLSAAIKLEPVASSWTTRNNALPDRYIEVIDDCYMVRGDSYYSMKRYGEAVQDYSRALRSLESIYQTELQRESAPPVQNVTVLQEESADEQSALWALKNNPCVLQPDEEQPEQQKQQASSSSGSTIHQHHQQVTSYNGQQALRRLIEVYLKRGSAYQYSSHNEQALSDYSRVIELCPQDVRGYYMRATLLDQMERYGDAVADYGRVIRLDPRHHIARSRLEALESKLHQ